MGFGRTGAAATMALLLICSCSASAQDSEPRYTITDEVVTVQSGTTMYFLVRDFYPNAPGGWLRVAQDLAEANPQAFRNGDPGSLIVGKTIRLVDYGAGVPSVGPDQKPLRPGAQDAQVTAAQKPDTPVVETPAATGPVAQGRTNENAATDQASEKAQTSATLTPASELVRIGQISQIRGTPLALDLNNRQRGLDANGAIYRGDTLLTDNNGRMSVVMGDGAVIRVRGNTRMTIEQYPVNGAPAQGNASVLTLVSGGMRLSSGKRTPRSDGVLINTAVATLTSTAGDLALRLCLDNECESMSSALPEGLYCGVAGGEVAVSNNTGSLSLTSGQALHIGTADTPAQLTPEGLGVVFDDAELADLDLQPDTPLGFWAWFRQRFLTFGDSPSSATGGT